MRAYTLYLKDVADAPDTENCVYLLAVTAKYSRYQYNIIRVFHPPVPLSMPGQPARMQPVSLLEYTPVHIRPGRKT